MPHDYSYAIRTAAGAPATATLPGGHVVFPDTASSGDAVLDEFAEEGGHPQEFQRFRFARLATSENQRLSLHLQGTSGTILLKHENGLEEFAKHGLERDLSSSSATIAAIIIAAEISLRLQGKLGKNELLSVPALEELTTVLTARKTVSTFYNTLKVAQQIGFLRERDVDPLTARFSGRPEDWNKTRFNLVDYVVLNDVHLSGSDRTKGRYTFSPEKVATWLNTGRPVLARVDPTRLEGVKLEFQPREKLPEAHQAVVIVGKSGEDFRVRTGWAAAPTATVKRDVPSECWGLVFDGDLQSAT
jgi:hypothetical protein